MIWQRFLESFIGKGLTQNPELEPVGVRGLRDRQPLHRKKQVKKKMKHVFIVYPIRGAEFGSDPDQDNKIRKLMKGYEEVGSGSGFGQRDISYVVDDDDVPEIEHIMTKDKEFSLKIFDYE